MYTHREKKKEPLKNKQLSFYSFWSVRLELMKSARACDL